MDRRLLGLAVLAVGMASACQGGGKAANSDEAFRARLCAASGSIAAGKGGVAGAFDLASETYGKLAAPPARKADLDGLVAASRAVAALWSDASPMTPDAFTEQDRKLAGDFVAAAERLRVGCSLQPAATSNAAAAFSVDRLVERLPSRPERVVWFFRCPRGVTLRYGAGVFPQRGGAGTVVDDGVGVSDTFTGVLANESYGRVAGLIKGACG